MTQKEAMDLNTAVIGRMLDATAARPRVFVTVSGAHLYGFASADSDYDLRGVFVLPVEDVIGLFPPTETMERTDIIDSVEVDYVAHDLAKFAKLLLKKNGYVLEQLFSPLIVRTSYAHDALKQIAQGCITRFHAHHYLGFADNQWKLFLKSAPHRVKPLLYTYRTLLTGIHLMRTGQIEANLRHLNADARLALIDDLIERKANGAEHETLNFAELDTYGALYWKLAEQLEQARDESALRDGPSAETTAELNDFVVRLRLSPAPE